MHFAASRALPAAVEVAANTIGTENRMNRFSKVDAASALLLAAPLAQARAAARRPGPLRMLLVATLLGGPSLSAAVESPTWAATVQYLVQRTSVVTESDYFAGDFRYDKTLVVGSADEPSGGVTLRQKTWNFKKGGTTWTGETGWEDAHRLADLRTIGEVHHDKDSSNQSKIVILRCSGAYPDCFEKARVQRDGTLRPTGSDPSLWVEYPSAELAERAAKAWRHLIRLAREAQPELDDDPFK